MSGQLKRNARRYRLDEDKNVLGAGPTGHVVDCAFLLTAKPSGSLHDSSTWLMKQNQGVVNSGQITGKQVWATEFLLRLR